MEKTIQITLTELEALLESQKKICADKAILKLYAGKSNHHSNPTRTQDCVQTSDLMDNTFIEPDVYSIRDAPLPDLSNLKEVTTEKENVVASDKATSTVPCVTPLYVNKSIEQLNSMLIDTLHEILSKEKRQINEIYKLAADALQKSETYLTDSQIELPADERSVATKSQSRHEPMALNNVLKEGEEAKGMKAKYEVRKAKNGDLCIMTKEYNVRIATFSKGTNTDADIIAKLLSGEEAGRQLTECYVDEETIREPITNALYATGRMFTDECDTVCDGILQYLKDQNLKIVRERVQ